MSDQTLELLTAKLNAAETQNQLILRLLDMQAQLAAAQAQAVQAQVAQQAPAPVYAAPAELSEADLILESSRLVDLLLRPIAGFGAVSTQPPATGTIKECTTFGEWIWECYESDLRSRIIPGTKIEPEHLVPCPDKGFYSVGTPAADGSIRPGARARTYFFVPWTEQDGSLRVWHLDTRMIASVLTRFGDKTQRQEWSQLLKVIPEGVWLPAQKRILCKEPPRELKANAPARGNRRAGESASALEV